MERGYLGREEVVDVPETWEVKDSQDSKGGTKDEIPNSGRGNL